MTQTCEKPDAFEELKKVQFKDEDCPWVADESRWSFDENSVTAYMMRNIELFEEVYKE